MGWKPVGFSEIEKFPSEVLAKHYPTVLNLGDMTKYKEWSFDESVDLLVGGTPCQSFSVAGLRKGLEDPRGNLALIYVGLLAKFMPQWFVWENVPGVLSSGGGRDFGSFLGAVAELGYGFSYRMLDAQHFGVPQRRRRIFVVGYLGDWRPTAEVLFESGCMRGDTAKSRKEGKDIANCLTKSPSSYSSYNPARSEGNAVVTTVYETHPADSRVKEMGETCQTVTSRWGTGGGNVPIAVDSYAIQGSMIGRQDHNGPQGDGVNEEISFTLNTTDRHAVAFKIRGGCEGGGKGYLGNDKLAYTLSTLQDQQLFVESRVRRLTPTECERLQGFPDGFTDIKEKGTPDSHRYKALGNSMAVPVMKWIGERIQAYETRTR
jgi:DNA (cytosine-5)-methyltransferase 1